VSFADDPDGAMADRMKPALFLSHIHEDQDTAQALESTIKEALLGAFDVFNSSNRTSLAVGDPWRDTIIERLRGSVAVLVLATPDSIGRPWTNFESGGAWVAGTRVLPCCARGMTPTGLPAPLSHLQAIDLSQADDLKQLIEHLAKIVQLDAPSNFDYSQATLKLISSWQAATSREVSGEFLAAIKRMIIRPNKYAGMSCEGLVTITHISDVEPLDSRQFPNAHLVPGDSIECWIKPHGENYTTLYHCYANGPIADLLIDLPENSNAEVTLICLGQKKVYETVIDLGDEDRGISYSPAFLIDKATLVKSTG
jgi:hypothetical protein